MGTRRRRRKTVSSQTSLVVKQFRLQTGAAQIQDCPNCSEGMNVDEWCRQNNITKANYYYHLKRVRQACLDFQKESEPSFIELPALPEPVDEPTAVTPTVSVVLHMSNGLTIELCDNASTEFMQKILRALCYAE